MRPLQPLLLVCSLVLGACGSSSAEGDLAKAGAGGSDSGGQLGTEDDGTSSQGGATSPGGATNQSGSAATRGGSAAGGEGKGGEGSSGEGSGGEGSGGADASRGCKRGIAWPGKKLDHPELNAKLPWWYRWAISADGVGEGLELVPMIWGGGTKVDANSRAIRAGAKYLLGYNEPNFFAQANLSAADAAADWPTVEAVAAAHDLKIVSPAVNYCGDVKNKTGPCHDNNPAHYLQDFFAACQDCQVDYVAVHWYNCDLASLKSYLDLFKQFKRPIWVTELACAIGNDTSVAAQEKYIREAVPYLEERPDVFRYSWFSADPIPNARLLNEDGSPNALGQLYLDLPHAATCAP